MSFMERRERRFRCELSSSRVWYAGSVAPQDRDRGRESEMSGGLGKDIGIEGKNLLWEDDGDR